MTPPPAPPPVSLFQIFTFALAVLANLAALGNLWWNIRSSRSRLKVELTDGLDSMSQRAGVFITIMNHSAHTIRVENADVAFPIKSPPIAFGTIIKSFSLLKAWITGEAWCSTFLDHYNVPTFLPVDLEARKSHKIFIPDNQVEKILNDALRRELRAHVQDGLWRNTYSSKFRVTWKMPSYLDQ